MASLDVSPQELRQTEIHDAWRGYNRDEVDELLERAAATIERLGTDLARGQAQTAAAPRPAAAAPAPAPAAPPVVPERRITAADTDVLARTLQLAQRAADEAIAEAELKARRMIEESEAKATVLVNDAELTARRIAETERARLDEDIRSLESARATLAADVEALERFEVDYRERIRLSIEHALSTLESTAVSSDGKPELHEIELPAPVETMPAREPGATIALDALEPFPEPGADGPIAESGPGAEWDAPRAAAWDQDDDAPASTGGWERPRIAADAAAPAPAYDAPYDADADYGDASNLDDDAFFASLREAVHDDGPLTSEDYGDLEDHDEHRGLFRRRR
jgi:DivIVA domain-containing protein